MFKTALQKKTYTATVLLAESAYNLSYRVWYLLVYLIEHVSTNTINNSLLYIMFQL